MSVSKKFWRAVPSNDAVPRLRSTNSPSSKGAREPPRARNIHHCTLASCPHELFVSRRVPHLTREVRLARLLIAASEIIEESGISAVTMTAIAERCDVSRQWLHEFFPDVEALYVALYFQYRSDFAVEGPIILHSLDDLAALISAECLALLELPVGPAIVVSHALHGLGIQSSSSKRPTLHNMLMRNINGRYVRPLVALGYDRDELTATVLTILNSTLGLLISTRDRPLSRDRAAEKILDIVDAVIADTLRSSPSDSREELST